MQAVTRQHTLHANKLDQNHQKRYHLSLQDSFNERHPDKESATLSKITIEWLCRSFQVWHNDDTLKALSSTQTGLAVRNSSITTCLSSVSFM